MMSIGTVQNTILAISGDSFQTACDIDKKIVKEEIGHMKERWDNLNYFISERAQALADILAKLGDFLNEAKDLEKGFGKVQPLGDRPGNLRDKARQEHCLIPVEGRKPCRLQGRPGCMG